MNTLPAPLLVALGGALGALTRYGLGLLAAGLPIGDWLDGGWLGSGWPWMTLLINVSGALVLGFISAVVSVGAWPAELKLLLGTGFLGAYTTFSTFSVESDGLLQRGEYLRAGLYMALSVGLGLGAAILGRVWGLRWAA